MTKRIHTGKKILRAAQGRLRDAKRKQGFHPSYFKFKPHVIEAWQFTSGDFRKAPKWLRNIVPHWNDEEIAVVIGNTMGHVLWTPARLYDWIVKMPDGRLYVFQPDLFNQLFLPHV